MSVTLVQSDIGFVRSENTLNYHHCMKTTGLGLGPIFAASKTIPTYLGF